MQPNKSMGLTSSSPARVQREQREQREQRKTELIAERKAQLDAVQSNMMFSSGSAEPGSGVIVPSRDIVNAILLTEKAKQQLNRGGGPLTKADLVAIVVALKPELRSADSVAQLEVLNTSDLNSMIRSIVYDPSRVLPSPPPSAAVSSNASNALTHSSNRALIELS